MVPGLAASVEPGNLLETPIIRTQPGVLYQKLYWVGPSNLCLAGDSDTCSNLRTIAQDKYEKMVTGQALTRYLNIYLLNPHNNSTK